MVYLIKATMMLGNSIIDAYIIWFIKLIQSRFRGELCKEAVTGDTDDMLAIMCIPYVYMTRFLLQNLKENSL